MDSSGPWHITENRPYTPKELWTIEAVWSGEYGDMTAKELREMADEKFPALVCALCGAGESSVEFSEVALSLPELWCSKCFSEEQGRQRGLGSATPGKKEV